VRALLTFIVHERGPMICANSPAPNPVLCREMRPLGDAQGPGYTASECGGGGCIQSFNPNDAAPNLQFMSVATMFEFEIEGTPYTLAQSFLRTPGDFWPGTPASVNSIVIGGWNPGFDSEAPSQSGEYVNMIPVGNQRDLQIRLREIGIAKFGADGIPVITEDVGKGIAADEDGGINFGVAKPLATVYRLRLSVRWAQGDTDGDVPEF
jgi:hypothetical protein